MSGCLFHTTVLHAVGLVAKSANRLGHKYTTITSETNVWHLENNCKAHFMLDKYCTYWCVTGTILTNYTTATFMWIHFKFILKIVIWMQNFLLCTRIFQKGSVYVTQTSWWPSFDVSVLKFSYQLMNTPKLLRKLLADRFHLLLQLILSPYTFVNRYHEVWTMISKTRRHHTGSSNPSFSLLYILFWRSLYGRSLYSSLFSLLVEELTEAEVIQPVIYGQSLVQDKAPA